MACEIETRDTMHCRLVKWWYQKSVINSRVRGQPTVHAPKKRKKKKKVWLARLLAKHCQPSDDSLLTLADSIEPTVVLSHTVNMQYTTHMLQLTFHFHSLPSQLAPPCYITNQGGVSARIRWARLAFSGYILHSKRQCGFITNSMES